MSRVLVATERGDVSLDRLGEGPDLVILHSLLTDRHAFDPVVPALSERWRVNLVDLPGFGESSLVDASIDSYADVVGALLEKGGFAPDATAVMGNGLGGFVALGAAIRHGDRFGRLVLVGCGVAFPDTDRQAFTGMAASVESGGMEAVVEVAVGRIYPEAYLVANPHLVDERRRVLLDTDPAAFVTACRALHAVDYGSQAGSITNPTLIVVGEDDGPTPPALAREVQSAIAGSTLVELASVGHAPQLQDPVRFLAAVEGFL
jgi:pimeloyl-ACP methyl ester carboxylesterase